MTEINKRMGDRLSVQGISAGLHVVLSFSSSSLDEAELVKRAAAAGVRVYPSAPYRLVNGNKPPSILVGFGGLSPDQIRQGIRLLSEAWFSP